MEPGPRLAVIHGQRRIVAFLELELSNAGFRVRSAESVSEGFALVRDWTPDVVLLDANVPGLDGVAFLRLLRLYSQVPIVVLGIGMELARKRAYLEAGADYCVSLPTPIEELLAILQATLRRPALRDADVRALGDLQMNFRDRTAHRAGRALALTRQEFDVLATLVRDPNRVFSRQELLSKVWGTEAQPTLRAVDACVASLRRKLDAPFHTALLRTIRGVGFTVRA